MKKFKTDFIKNITKQLEGLKEVEKDINPTFFDPVAKAITKRFKDEWEKGTGTDKDHNPKSMDKLKPSTIKSRRIHQKLGKLSNKTTPDKSNMIDTGKMIEETDYVLKQKGFEIVPPSDRQDAAEYNKKKRPLFYLNKTYYNYIQKKILEKLKKGTELTLRKIK